MNKYCVKWVKKENFYFLFMENPFALELSNPVANYTDYPWIQSVWDTLRNFYRSFILRGLARLYIYGPYMYGMGFWQGRQPQHICAQLSQIHNEDFWTQNMDTCYELISRNFYSWVVLLETILYFVLLIKCCSVLLHLLRWIGSEVFRKLSSWYSRPSTLH